MKKLITFFALGLLICSTAFAQNQSGGTSQRDPICEQTPGGTTDRVETETIPLAELLGPTPPPPPPDPDPEPGELRGIYFVHGLRGSVGSWAPVAKATEDGATGFPARNAKTLRLTYSEESDFDAAAATLESDATSKDGELLQAGGDPQSIRNFFISHSNGTLVARWADHKNPGGAEARRMHGLVSFGSSHAGAPIAANAAQMQNLADDICHSLLNGIDSWLPGPTGIGQMVAKDFICEKLQEKLEEQSAPIMAHIPPGSAFIEQLKTTEPTFPTSRRVAFIGIETEEVFWRELWHLLIKKPSAQPAFTANDGDASDDNAMKWIKNIRGTLFVVGTALTVSATFNAFTLKFKKAASQSAKADKTFKAFNALKDANDKYKAIIGHSTITVTVPNGGHCVCHENHWDANGIPTYTSDNVIANATPENCPQNAYNAPGVQVSCGWEASFTQQVVEGASDGVVPVWSQAAYPGAAQEEMPGSNHQSMRNDANTKAGLFKLYQGLIHPWFLTNTK